MTDRREMDSETDAIGTESTVGIQPDIDIRTTLARFESICRQHGRFLASPQRSCFKEIFHFPSNCRCIHSPRDVGYIYFWTGGARLLDENGSVSFPEFLECIVPYKCTSLNMTSSSSS